MREWSTWAGPETGTPLQLFRPLLAITREQTEAVCAEAGIVPARDLSNSSLAFARNRVRHLVLQELKQLNPNVRVALARFALAAQEDEEFLQGLAGSSVEGHAKKDGSAVTWPRALLAALPRPLLVRAFQTAWEAVCKPGAALSKAHLDAMADLLASPSVRQVRLPHGMTFSVSGRACRLGPVPFVEASPGGPLPLAIPGVTQAGQWRVAVQELAVQEVEVQERVAPSQAGRSWQLPTDPWRAYLDADLVGTPIALRCRRPGDRFHSKGMAGPKRLQDFYVDAKVPRDQRDAVPLLVGPGGIAWVVGHRVAAWASAGPATRRVLDVSVRRTESESPPVGP
jgi:tRNA(Ile)-lysidine synthase